MCSLTLNAQNKKDEIDTRSPFYVGVKGGLPMAVSTFSSFGEDRFRAGCNFGALFGYSYDEIFSAEFSASFL